MNEAMRAKLAAMKGQALPVPLAVPQEEPEADSQRAVEGTRSQGLSRFFSPREWLRRKKARKQQKQSRKRNRRK